MDWEASQARAVRAVTMGLCCVIASIGCQKVPSSTGPQATNSTPGAPASGSTISSGGSSTVFPIAQGVAEHYKQQNPAVEIEVGLFGTSGGFKKLINKEIDICNASRPITESERKACADNGIESLELQVAVDGLTVVVNQDNTWIDCLSVAQLKKVWEPDSQVQKWSDLDPNWPAEKIQLFGADPDSGTFDYFTEVINGKARVSRTDYTPASNDNVLVQGVVNEKNALGYFGYGYYVENQQRLKSVSIKDGDDGDCVPPTIENIDAGKYHPLARPLFIYVNKAALSRPEVAGYLKFFLSEEGQAAVVERKFVRMRPDALHEMQQRLDEALAAAK